MNISEGIVIENVLVWLIPGVTAITLHEYAHGWVAARLGDTTAREAGRLSLNPLRHVDPIGTIILPGLMLFANLPFIFGWAKPVPVNFQRLKGGRLGTFLVAIAGVVANLLMLLGWLIALYGLIGFGGGTSVPSPNPLIALFIKLSLAGVIINLALMLFNLIPLPPLDGGRVLGALLPEALSKPYMRLERYGIFILLALIATGAFRHVFDPLLNLFLSLLGLS
ncbi:MAG: site-2 protease family protein [Alphaproteobacteria bacterium]|nr:site-2 protease family protein [Alphaproteobacteria bacterium]